MLPVPVIHLKPSSLLIAWITLLHGFVAFVPLFLPWPAPLRIALALIVLVDGWFVKRRFKRVYGLAAIRVNMDHELQMQVQTQENWQTLELRSPCFLLPFVAILHVKRENRRRAERWLLLPGMMRVEDWRKLRVWMKWRLPELLPKHPGLWAKLKQKVIGAKPE